MKFTGYDVDFRWKGDIRDEQERMIAWLKDHGEDIVAGFCTDGTGSVTVNNIEHVYGLARDLSVTIVSAKYIEEEWEEEEPVTA